MINRWYRNIVTGTKAKLVNILDAEPYGFSAYKLEYILQYENGDMVTIGAVAFRTVWEMM